jgi:SEL1 protein
MWAERGAEYGDREAENVLGVLWRDGKDVKKAAGYFGVAAGHDHYEGIVNLGKASYGACARGAGV